MSSFSDTIKKLRKEKGVTQAELGKILSISPQAISKWEKGISEPDTETLRTLSDYFQISVDELLGGETPVDETKGSNAQPNIIIGYCDKCKRPIEQKEHYSVHHTAGRHSRQYIYCDECEKERQHTVHVNEAKEKSKKLKKGLGWGIAVGIILLIIFAAAFISEKKIGVAVISGLIAGYVGLAFVSQLFWGDWIIGILAFFCKSFRMPGVIFELSLDGIISLICIKLLLGILSWLLSTFIFLIGLFIACACSVFTFPFALPKCIKEKNSAEALIK